jgi:uncharacterized protein (DUF362 family)
MIPTVMTITMMITSSGTTRSLTTHTAMTITTMIISFGVTIIRAKTQDSEYCKYVDNERFPQLIANMVLLLQ